MLIVVFNGIGTLVGIAYYAEDTSIKSPLRFYKLYVTVLLTKLDLLLVSFLTNSLRLSSLESILLEYFDLLVSIKFTFEVFEIISSLAYCLLSVTDEIEATPFKYLLP